MTTTGVDRILHKELGILTDVRKQTNLWCLVRVGVHCCHSTAGQGKAKRIASATIAKMNNWRTEWGVNIPLPNPKEGTQAKLKQLLSTACKCVGVKKLLSNIRPAVSRNNNKCMCSQLVEIIKVRPDAWDQPKPWKCKDWHARQWHHSVADKSMKLSAIKQSKSWQSRAEVVHLWDTIKKNCCQKFIREWVCMLKLLHCKQWWPQSFQNDIWKQMFSISACASATETCDHLLKNTFSIVVLPKFVCGESQNKKPENQQKVLFNLLSQFSFPCFQRIHCHAALSASLESEPFWFFVHAKRSFSNLNFAGSLKSCLTFVNLWNFQPCLCTSFWTCCCKKAVHA